MGSPTPSAPDAVPVERWEGATPAEWRARWRVPDLRIFRSVGSTNDVARALAEQGAPAGTVILAEQQLRGRGRRGREWIDRPGQSLLMSILLRPAEGTTPDADAASVLPLRIGLAVAQAIEQVAGIDVGIKWPNDLLVGGRKLGGLLCEGAVEGERTLFVVVGIGLNVLQRDDDWPAPLRPHATSISAAAGRAVPMAGLAARVVDVVSIAADAGALPLRPDELEAVARRDVLRGRAVTVDGRPAGKAIGIDAGGALVVEDEGSATRIMAGTVRLAANGEEERVDER